MLSKLWNISKIPITLIAKLSLLYTVLLLARAVLFGYTGGIAAFIISLVIVFSGYVIAHLLTGNKQTSTRLLLAYLPALIPAVIIALACVLFFHKQVLAGILEGVAAFLLYFIGARAKFVSFQLTLNRKTVFIGVIIFLASAIFIDYYIDFYIFYYDIDSGYLKNAVFLLGYCFIVSTLLVKNQQNLDKAFIQKHIEISTVPGGIRNYNSIIIVLLFTVILILFNIKSLGDTILLILKNAPKYIVIMIFYIFKFLSMLIAGGDGTQAEQGQQETQMPVLPKGESGGILSKMLTVAFLLLALYILFLLIKKMPKIFSFIRQKIQGILFALMKFFGRLFAIQRNGEIQESDYIDEVEMIKPEERDKGSVPKDGIFQRARKRLFSGNLSIDQKVRRIYAEILHNLKMKGIVLHQSDTSHEIMEKIPQVGDLTKSMQYITDVYDQVRYGEKSPKENEFKEYENKGKQVINILRAKKL